MQEEETIIWKGHPSHVKDLGFHVVCGLFAWLVLPLGFMLWRFLTTKFTEYEITSERLRITKGVLSKRMDETELYRVKDTSIDQPFFLRLFKLANLELSSSDSSTPHVTLFAIADARVTRENLRGCIEKMRIKRGVREIDYS